MYGIYANIGGILMVNVTIYSIHGSYGIMICSHHTRTFITSQAVRLCFILNPNAFCCNSAQAMALFPQSFRDIRYALFQERRPFGLLDLLGFEVGESSSVAQPKSSVVAYCERI